jgi:hypothetical protein
MHGRGIRDIAELVLTSHRGTRKDQQQKKKMARRIVVLLDAILHAE